MQIEEKDISIGIAHRLPEYNFEINVIDSYAYGSRLKVYRRASSMCCYKSSKTVLRFWDLLQFEISPMFLYQIQLNF
jgi:hypothetical protein